MIKADQLQISHFCVKPPVHSGQLFCMDIEEAEESLKNEQIVKDLSASILDKTSVDKDDKVKANFENNQPEENKLLISIFVKNPADPQYF